MCMEKEHEHHVRTSSPFSYVSLANGIFEQSYAMSDFYTNPSPTSKWRSYGLFDTNPGTCNQQIPPLVRTREAADLDGGKRNFW